MLYQFRRHLRVLAAAVLVSVSVVGGWSASTHGLDDHDADRAVGFVVHDASAHAFRSPGPDGDRPKHCVLCHWTRTFGPSLQSMSVAPALASRTLAVQAVDIGLFHSGAAVQPPLRAPPVPPAVDVFA